MVPFLRGTLRVQATRFQASGACSTFSDENALLNAAPKKDG